MARDDRPGVSVWYALGVLVVVVVAIVVVLALSVVPHAARPEIRQVVTVTPTP